MSPSPLIHRDAHGGKDQSSTQAFGAIFEKIGCEKIGSEEELANRSYFIRRLFLLIPHKCGMRKKGMFSNFYGYTRVFGRDARCCRLFDTAR